MLGWLGRNLSSLLLSFVLAVVVWVAAIISTDPNEERIYPRAIELEVIGSDSDYMIMNDLIDQVTLTLFAPQSIWNELIENPDNIRSYIDLTGLGKGEHTVDVNVQVDLSPVQIIKVDPAEVDVILEPLVRQTFPVQTSVTGDPALGYRKSSSFLDPTEVTISGPESAMSQIVEVHASLDVTGANDTVVESVNVRPLDENRQLVRGVTITPPSVTITQPVILQGGYRNVVVKVVTNGQVAEGYWLTNVSVTPPNVTVFSTDPQAVNELPGFVETNPIDLTDLNDDVDIRATLDLPEDITLAGEESVLVRLSIAALEGSLPINLPVEIIGLSPEYRAILSPDTVDLLLVGPLTILNNLNPASIRVSVDLSGLELGIHQVPVVVDLLPNQVGVSDIIPENIEASIELAPTPTPTSAEATPLGSASTQTFTPTSTPGP
jgi:YbbR domain-containing protein